MSFDVNRNGKIGIIEKQTKNVNLLLRENSILLTRSWFVCLPIFYWCNFLTNPNELERNTIHHTFWNSFAAIPFPPQTFLQNWWAFFLDRKENAHIHTYTYIHTDTDTHTSYKHFKKSKTRTQNTNTTLTVCRKTDTFNTCILCNFVDCCFV